MLRPRRPGKPRGARVQPFNPPLGRWCSASIRPETGTASPGCTKHAGRASAQTRRRIKQWRTSASSFFHAPRPAGSTRPCGHSTMIGCDLRRCCWPVAARPGQTTSPSRLEPTRASLITTHAKKTSQAAVTSAWASPRQRRHCARNGGLTCRCSHPCAHLLC